MESKNRQGPKRYRSRNDGYEDGTRREERERERNGGRKKVYIREKGKKEKKKTGF